LPLFGLLVSLALNQLPIELDATLLAMAVGIGAFLLRRAGATSIRVLAGRDYLIDGAIALGTVATLLLFRFWTGAFIALCISLLISQRLVPPLARLHPLIRAVTVWFSYGVLLPLLGALLSDVNRTGDLVFLVISAAVALSAAPGLVSREIQTTRARRWATVAALVGVTAAALLTLSSAPLGLTFEQALLPSILPLVIVLIGWLVLIDPDPDRRWFRGARFAHVAAVTLLVGAGCMLLWQ
jgi:hypothetical protein